MKSAARCNYDGQELSVEKAIELRDRSNTKLFFSCIVCKEAVKPHKTGSDGSSAHFEHYERNYTCPHSEGKSEGQSKVQSRYPTDSDSAKEGYSKDDKILASTRNVALAKKRKFLDDYTCQACDFKLKLNGRYVIECHHKHPLSAGVRDTTIDDLISLCPTCHRIAHTSDEPLPLGKIKSARKII